MRILAIESSAATGSVALVESNRGAALLEREFDASKNRSVELPKAAAELLREAGRELRPEEIRVGIGPGNYTGLRVAVAAAQGLGLALGLPVVGVPSWFGMERRPGERWLIGNAGRGRVFRVPLDARGTEAVDLIEAREMPQWLAAQPAGAVLRLNSVPGAEGVEERHPKAALLGLAVLPPRAGGGPDAGPVEPVYLQAACEAPPLGEVAR